MCIHARVQCSKAMYAGVSLCDIVLKRTRCLTLPAPESVACVTHCMAEYCGNLQGMPVRAGCWRACSLSRRMTMTHASAVIAGERDTLLLLLEDLRRFQDALPALWAELGMHADIDGPAASTRTGQLISQPLLQHACGHAHAGHMTQHAALQPSGEVHPARRYRHCPRLLTSAALRGERKCL
jgi:hypothetical protein